MRSVKRVRNFAGVPQDLIERQRTLLEPADESFAIQILMTRYSMPS